MTNQKPNTLDRSMGRIIFLREKPSLGIYYLDIWQPQSKMLVTDAREWK